MARLTRRNASLALLAGFLLPAAAAACMWDSDTVKVERTRFPGTLELVTGKFLRHSPEFYRWRIEDRTRRLAADPGNAALRDDLAVAYDKTGDHDRAIAAALETERLRPGRYETASNLGTFYFHAGRLDEALTWVSRALAINPDAHFGREKYQKALTEYVIARRRLGDTTLPLAHVPTRFIPEETFANFLRLQGRGGSDRPDPAAVKGVLGMMRFADHESPVLLEALGTLLASPVGAYPEADAKLLAARAFLKASDAVPDGPQRAAYRRMAEGVIELQLFPPGVVKGSPLGTVEADFRKELQEGRDWYAGLREREVGWIRDGLDPEAEFDKLYAADPEVSPSDDRVPVSAETAISRMILVGVAVMVLATAAAFLAARWVWRRRAASRSGERPAWQRH